MKVKLGIIKETAYVEAEYDSDLHQWIKEWYAIQHRNTGLGTLHINLDKRNWKKVKPLMVLYKFEIVGVR